DELIDSSRIENFVIRPLSSAPPSDAPQLTVHDLARRSILAGEVEVRWDEDRILDDLLRGDTVVALAGTPGALVVSMRRPPARQVGEPQVAVIARGPRDSFTETARWNLALIRRRLTDANLRIERLTIGARSKTDVYLLYIDDVVNRTALQELRRRVNHVN